MSATGKWATTESLLGRGIRLTLRSDGQSVVIRDRSNVRLTVTLSTDEAERLGQTLLRYAWDHRSTAARLRQVRRKTAAKRGA